MNALPEIGGGRDKNNKGSHWRRVALASCVALGVAATMLHAPATAWAQTDDGGGRYDDTSPTAPTSYTDGDTTPASDPNADPIADAANSGPVRMARFTVVGGDVTWRGGTDGDWTAGVTNMPLRQGAQVWVSNGGHAEIQFDDGSRLRLDSNTLITLQTLYSDTKGEYTEITLNDGQVALRTTNEFSVYQVNTPLCSVKSAGPSKVRVGAGAGVQVAVREGTATVQGTADHARLHSGDAIDLADASSTYDIADLPKSDAWDAYNDERDRAVVALADAPTAQHLPPAIAASAGDLDQYGTWREDTVYGSVWVPQTNDPNWRPYYAGHWTWVEPFGWTWVSSEPWGWAPYHYGTWVHTGWGWSWVPGPREQYWSPGVVAFYQDGGQVAWCPLAPREVHYPAAITIGFRSARWSAYFAVGGAAVYYPGAHNICEPRPWAPTYVNHGTYTHYVRTGPNVNVTNVNITNVTINHNTYVNNRFIASNARYGGAVAVASNGFDGGHGGHYVPVERGDIFVNRAHVMGAPMGGRPMGGPPSWRPTQASLSPTGTFHQNLGAPGAILNRPVYRAAPPPIVGQNAAAPALHGQRFIDTPRGNRPGGSVFGGNGNTGGGRNNGSGNSDAPRPAFGNAAGNMSGRPSSNRGGLQDYLRDRNGNDRSNGSNRSNGGRDGGGTLIRPSGDTNGGRVGDNRVSMGNTGNMGNGGNPSSPRTTGGGLSSSGGNRPFGGDRTVRSTSGGDRVFGGGSNGGSGRTTLTPGNGTPAPTVTTGGNSEHSGYSAGRLYRGGLSSGGDRSDDRRGSSTPYSRAPITRDNSSSPSPSSAPRSESRPTRTIGSGSHGSTSSRGSGSRDSSSKDSDKSDSRSSDGGSRHGDH